MFDLTLWNAFYTGVRIQTHSLCEVKNGFSDFTEQHETTKIFSPWDVGLQSTWFTHSDSFVLLVTSLNKHSELGQEWNSLVWSA